MRPAPLARPEATALLTRGVARLLIAHGFAPLCEVGLANGRRADVLGVGAKGEIVLVEVKSCLEDYRVDAKWRDYAPFCDAFYFAVGEDFPLEALPGEVGLIVADGFGGAFLRPAAAQPPLAGGRRKAILVAFARHAALRLAAQRAGPTSEGAGSDRGLGADDGVDA